MLKLVRTDSSNIHFRNLVSQLDMDLSIRNGDSNAFYMQFNKIDELRHVVVCYINDLPIGCGALKSFDQKRMEVKRMYVLPDYRGQGIAIAVLNELEKWATELNYEACILETGKMQPEAITLYHKCNYQIIPNYGQYIGDEKSVCFEKTLIKSE